MHILGIDPSSSVCGVAVVEGEKIIEVDHWTAEKNAGHPHNLHSYALWLRSYIDFRDLDVAAIELLSVERNAKATRAIAFFQGASALVCKERGLVVIETRVTTARRIALGNGGMSKDEAWKVMTGRYPHTFARKDQGGADEMDAAVLGLAGPRAIEKG